jgi:hypothetical protein
MPDENAHPSEGKRHHRGYLNDLGIGDDRLYAFGPEPTPGYLGFHGGQETGKQYEIPGAGFLSLYLSVSAG